MDFKTQVIDRSFDVPVVVDFWAEWCGPCRQLGPVIEELAGEANGKWELYKLNTEHDQETAMQYKIRGIPAVKMIYKGEVIAEFTGALPKYQIQQWLNEHLLDERNNSLDQILKNGSLDDLKSFVEANPDITNAKFELALRIAKDEPQAALELYDSLLGDPKFIDKATDAKALVELVLCDANNANEDVHPKVIESIATAKSALINDDYATTLEHLIQSIMYNKAYCDEMARRACIAIFHTLGEEHEISKKFRRRFNMALY